MKYDYEVSIVYPLKILEKVFVKNWQVHNAKFQTL